MKKLIYHVSVFNYFLIIETIALIPWWCGIMLYWYALSILILDFYCNGLLILVIIYIILVYVYKMHNKIIILIVYMIIWTYNSTYMITNQNNAVCSVLSCVAPAIRFDILAKRKNVYIHGSCLTALHYETQITWTKV